MRALFLGRFQPFHLGHLKVIKNILAECDEIIIAVGSATFNYLEKSPFTAGERVWMIHESLKEAKIDMERVYIIPYPNIENNALWVFHLRSLLPPFEVAYSGNPLPQILLKEAGIKVKTINMIERDKYTASGIREKMLKGEKWEDLVPAAVVRIIEKIKGVERLKLVSKAESDPLHW